MMRWRCHLDANDDDGSEKEHVDDVDAADDDNDDVNGINLLYSYCLTHR